MPNQNTKTCQAKFKNFRMSKINVMLASVLIIVMLKIFDSKPCAKHFVVDTDCFKEFKINYYEHQPDVRAVR